MIHRRTIYFYLLFFPCAVVCFAQDTARLPQILDQDTKLRDAKKTEERIPLLEEGLQIAETANDNHFIAQFSFRLGAILLVKKDYRKSEEYLKKSIAADPALPQAHAYLGRLYYVLKRWDEAEREFKAGLSFEPLKAATLNQLVTIMFQSERWEEALSLLRDWEAIAPDNEAIFWRRGFVLTSLKKYGEAETAFKRSLELKPSMAAYLYFGNLRYLQERDQEALQLMLEAEKLSPEDPEVQWRLGVLYRFMKNNEEAERRFLRAIEISPSSDAYGPYAYLLFSELKKPVEGEAAYKKFIELGGTPTVGLLAVYATEMTSQGRFQEAIQAWEPAYAKEPDNVAVVSGMAYTLFLAERLEETAPLLEKAVRLKAAEGGSAEREIGMVAVIYDQLGKYEEGAALLRQTVVAATKKKDPLLAYLGLLGLADLYIKQGQHKEALITAEKAVQSVHHVPEFKTLLISGQLAIASEAATVREFDLAERKLIEVLPVIESSEATIRASKMIEYFEVQSYLRSRRSDYEGAIEASTHAFELALDNQLIEKQLDSLDRLSSLYRTTGEFTKSTQMFETFLRTLEQIKSDQVKNKYLETAAGAFVLHGDYQEALNSIDKAFASRAVQSIPIRASEALQKRAFYLGLLGKYDEALKAYEKALERISKKPRVPGLIISCKEQMADVYMVLGNYRKARELLQDARDLAREIKRRDLVVGANVALGDLDYDLGDFDQAFRTYQESAGIYRELESWSGESDQYFRMGAIREEQKKYDEALVFFQKSLDLSEKKKDVINAFYAKEGIARQNMYKGSFAEAQQQMEELLRVLQESGIGFSGLKNRITHSVGELHLLQHHYPEAERHLASVVASETSATYPTKWKSWYLLGLAQKELGKSDEALKSMKTSVEIVERMRQATAGTPQDGNFRARYREIYNALIDLLMKERRLDEAYYYIELQKIVEFEEQRIASQRFEPPSEETKRARQYQFRLMEIQKQLSAEVSKDSTFRDQDLIDNLNHFLGALEREFKGYLREHPELEAKLEHKPRQIGSIMNSIPEGVIVIQPVVLPDRIAALVYSHSGRLPVESAPVQVQEVQQQLNAFRSALRDGTTREAQEASSRFYEWLIRPIENQIEEAKLLVVAASGNLRKIPFQALYDAKSEKFLVQKLAVVNLSSLKFEFPDWEKENIRILAVADPSGDLKEANEQAGRIAKIFPTKIFAGEEAGAESLRWDKTKEKYTVLMFATHATLDDLNPEESYILLAHNERLKYENIAEYRPYWQDEIRMAVLSGCETAALPEIEESAISHLAGEFDEIGIHSIVASLWKVNDASTSDLMVSFFENLKKDLSLAESLRIAQLKLLEQGKSPYHWAPFILMGDWR